MRISYQVIKEGPVSICGVQTENTFRRFLMKRTVLLGATILATCMRPSPMRSLRRSQRGVGVRAFWTSRIRAGSRKFSGPINIIKIQIPWCLQ